MKIALLGDVALFGNMSVIDNPRLSDYFSDIADYLGGFDYVVGNLETPFSVEMKKNGAKSAFLCSDIANIQILKLLHVKAVNLANNHMFDYGREGYETTKSVLTVNGIDYFGTEGKELRVSVGGEQLAFSGYCCYSSGPLQCVPSGGYGVNAYNLLTVKQSLERNNSEGFFNIVAIHAGIEHVNYPSLEHIKAARKLARYIPFVYYGHHPHVIQGIEEYDGSVIAHSLGNFCFDDIYTKASGKNPLVTLSENNRHGLILELTIEGGKILKWREQVVYISKGDRLLLVENDEMIERYNHALVNSGADVDAYIQMREELLKKWSDERKANRSLTWYIKRMRPMYLQILRNARKNSELYKENILNFIAND